MPIQIRDDLVYIILKKVHECDRGPGPDEVNFTETDFAGMEVTPAALLGHLDYLNQEQYINAEFSGNAYGNQEDVPNAVNPKEFDLRIANTFGSSDGPLPHLIAFKKAELTTKGEKMLEDMEANPPKAIQNGPTVPILDEHMPFLQKVMLKGNISDPYDARDITEVVFRVMRDVMTTEASDRVASELHEEASQARDKSLRLEIAELWKDTNPIVGFISRLRPPLKGPGLSGINSERFLTRVDNEGSVPPTTNAERVIEAVFSATKEELSPDRIDEIGQSLPEGKVRELWQRA